VGVITGGRDGLVLMIFDEAGTQLAPATSVAVPTRPLQIWASPEAMAVAAWLTVLLTLIAVILTAVQLAQDQGPAPMPVQIVINVSPGP
jgi:hypothetical protein